MLRILAAFVFSVVIIPLACLGQAWSGVLDTSRAIDWSSQGVKGGIPTSWANCVTTACNTLNGGTVTIASINAAIASAPASTVVRVPCGSFSFTAGLNITSNNFILRGCGADSTILTFTGVTAADFLSGSIMVWGGENNCCPVAGGTIQHSGTWSAGYAKGTTVITLSSTTGLAVGNIIVLDQLDDTVDGWPAAGDIIVSTSSASPRFTSEGGGNVVRSTRANSEVFTVTAINGSNVTIDPPIELPNYRSGQSPGAWWGNTTVQNVGIENMTIDSTGNTGNDGIGFYNALNCWIKGVRSIAPVNSQTEHYNVRSVVSARITIRDSYVYGPASQANTNYGITSWLVSDLLFENNIGDAQQSFIVENAPEVGAVYGYNYVANTVSGAAPSHVPHEGGEAMDLYEGNDWTGVRYDIIHGTHQFFTTHRNFFNGGPLGEAPAHLASFNRFMNFVGNVLGSATYNTYQTSGTPSGTEIFNFGDPCSGCSGGTVSNDSRVLVTSLRWGNWDNVTNGVRWCGNSSDTGWSTTCGSTSEIPTGITNFSNAVPTLGDTVAGQGALPKSFYLSAKPGWFGAVPYPPIGPDVSGGNISNAGGHANKIPARVCYESLVNDPAYPSSSPRIKTFNASVCYPSTSGQQSRRAFGFPK